MPTDKITLFTRLVALSSSPNENEARTAAFKAIKLLGAEQGLVVLAADDPRLQGPSVRPGEPGWEETEWGRFAREEAMRLFERMRVAFLQSNPPPERAPKPGEPGWEASPAGRWAIAEAARLFHQQVEMLRRQGRAPSGAPSKHETATAKPGKKHLPGWRYYEESKWGGTCSQCATYIPKGSAIYWMGGGAGGKSKTMCPPCCEAV